MFPRTVGWSPGVPTDGGRSDRIGMSEQVGGASVTYVRVSRPGDVSHTLDRAGLWGGRSCWSGVRVG